MSKIVKPINNPNHSFQFQPRYDFTNDVLILRLTNEATNEETEVSNTFVKEKNELREITFEFDFAERDKYQIRILDAENVVYRGKLFATDQETQDFNITDDFITY